jgi:hypothetical protein
MSIPKMAAAFLSVGLLTGQNAGAAGWAPVPPGAVPPPRAAGPPPRAAAAPRAVASLPEPIVLPGPAGCTLRAAKSGVGVTLEIAPGVPYARVAQFGSLEVTLPIGRDAPAAGVSVAAGNVRLKGLATPAGLALYPARPFVVGEVLVPGPHSRLRWGEVAADRVAVEVPLAKEIRTEFRDMKGPLRTSRPCADLRLTSLGSFDSYDALGGRGSDLAAGLRSSSPVPIAAQPNGPPLAKLVVNRKAALNEVTVIDEDAAGWSRIARPATGDLLVVGWVKQKQLGKPPARETTFAAFNAGGIKPGASGGATVDQSAVYACAHEIPLVAEVGAQRRTVGSIGGGVHLLTSATAVPEFVAVQFPDGAASSVTPFKGTRLLVRRADVAGCPGFAAR